MPKLVPGGVAVLLCAVIVVHLGLGAAGVGIADVLSTVFGHADENTKAVLWGSRVPRTLAGLVAGLALGLSGALIQGATRNPLAAPDTLGVNAGAYVAVAAVAFTGLNVGVLGGGVVAFLGGVVAVAVVYLLTASGVLTPGRVLLAGATVSLAGYAAAEFLQILDQQATQGLFFWGNGSLLQTGISRPLMMGAVVLVAALFTPMFARPLDLLSLGDETAQAMGVRVNRIRPAALVLAVLLAAAAVTVAGPIGFVGLIAPVAVRLLGIHGHSLLVPLSGLVAATLVLGADAAAQVISPVSAGYSELPVGIVTALIGGPIFIVLARRVTTGDADRGAAVAVAPPRKNRFVVALSVGIAVLAVALVVGLRVGDVDISWSQLASAITGSGQEMANAIVSFRLPRLLVAAVAGACLAVAGVAVQSVVRNPLAEPGIMGITGGASAAAMLLIVVVPAAPVAALPIAATVGGLLALVLVMVIARQLDPTRVVLIGLGVAATTTALVNIMVVSAQMNITAALTWLAGSTYARDISALGWMVLPAVVAVLLVVGARAVNMLALGDDLPRSLGLAVGRTRMLVLGGGALLAAGTAAAVGTVGFVGLVAPHLARRVVGTNITRLVPMAAVLGAVLVVAADTVGRSLLAPTEIPVGVVTALIGTPYLVWLLRAK
nr:iron ABC transporter permease [Kibdelosporangium sp. MJ126-NF4]CEL14485.1 Ferric hydroxamate ABC transporter (TC 3.A.1.14.3), permease component FhuB [Kibdelosporangium sp. MJ126-NF4]CTQ88850.1 Ferric hydroxamate ABC transporter (TC 3.A.1.14.3), permease component FhuB [Kibdelosporangium sp. MJ126-NF4]